MRYELLASKANSSYAVGKAMMGRALSLCVITLIWLSGCTDWHIQTVDSSDDLWGDGNCLALDSSDHPHISYLSHERRGDSRRITYLKYAVWNGAEWDIQTVGTAVGEGTSLVLDSNGSPHISYYDDRPRLVTYRGTQLCHVLKYAAWNGQSRSWDIQPVDDAIPSASFASLALDSKGYPRIAYCAYTDLQKHYDTGIDSVRYAAWNGSSWDIQTVDSVGGRPSLALDSGDQPHISYLYDEIDEFNGGPSYVKYAAWNGSSWDIQAVDSLGVWSVSLALDSRDYPQISYGESSPGDPLKHAVWNGSAWRITTVDSGGALSVSLALDSRDYPHISYDQWEGDLKYAAWNGSSWDIQTVDSTGDLAPIDNSLALGSSGFAHISYSYSDMSTIGPYGAKDILKYATKAPELSNADGTTLE